MGTLIADHDWAATPLGPIEEWPACLRAALGLCLESPFPTNLYWGPELRLLYNDAYAAVLGRKHPDSLGEPGFGPKGWAEIESAVGPGVRGVLEGTDRMLEEDGLLIMQRHGFAEECYFTYSCTPIRDEAGVIRGVFNVALDTTRRVVGERRLAMLQALAGKAVEDNPTLEAAGAAAVAVLRASDADVPFALLYLRDGDALRAVGPVSDALASAPWPCRDVLATGEAVRVRNEDGRYGTLPGGRWPEPAAEALLLPIATGSDGPNGVLVVGISPRRPYDAAYRGFLDLVARQISATLANIRALLEARSREEALASLDRAKTAFFDNVSHELRTPLTLLLAPIRDALASDERALAGASLEAAHRNALRLSRLTNTLLDFSRVQAGRVEASFERTDLARYTSELASSFRSLFESVGLDLVVDCPPLPADTWVDRALWEPVVLNLVSNAFKHTFEGGVRVALRVEGDTAVTEVADTGVGIPPEHLGRLFDRFHRVPGTRARTHEGTGIGLALVQELVRLHGGTIEVTSEPGRGSVFRVRLPLGRAHLPDARIRPETPLATPDVFPALQEAQGWLPADDLSAPDEQAAGATPRPRVLLADDNADMRAYVRRLLAPHWDVRTVADGLRALEEARRAPPDLVLTDVMMPGLDGFGLLRALRDDPATRLVPVVLLSARAGEEARVGGLDAGADDYLVKPFSAEELVARVRSHVELGRLRRAREREMERINADLERLVAERTAVLAEQTAALEASNRELTAFTYTIAHDLRAPLRSLARFAEILNTEYRDRPLDAAGQNYTERLVIAARRMDALVNGLLAYGRVNRTEVRLHRVELAPLVEEAAQHLLEEGELSVAADLPAVMGDTVLLGQVLANLLSNAAKFVHPGARPRVTVGADRVDGLVRVWVQDEGIGIAPEYRERIFRVFERLHGENAYEGTGIGLAIVQRALERMGGRVGVASAPGDGARFWFELPEAA